jgi:hypothetical protein
VNAAGVQLFGAALDVSDSARAMGYSDVILYLETGSRLRNGVIGDWELGSSHIPRKRLIGS